MTARLQQFLTVSILAVSLAALILFAKQGLLIVGIFAALAIGCFYALIIAAELMLMAIVVGRKLRPPLRSMIAAWSRETMLAPCVFYWRQPFRASVHPNLLPELPDGRTALILVHGFLCNRGFWNPWMKRLRVAEIPFIAVNLEPVFGSISGMAQQIEEAVLLVRAKTGTPPVIVAHSMGGLAARNWLYHYSGEGRVQRIITVGTPHKGTWLARFSHSTNTREMAVGSAWLSSLSALSTPAQNAIFTCFYSDCDNVVFPCYNAMLEGADNRLVRGAAHVDLAFRPEVIRQVIAQLTRGSE